MELLLYAGLLWYSLSLVTLSLSLIGAEDINMDRLVSMTLSRKEGVCEDCGENPIAHRVTLESELDKVRATFYMCSKCWVQFITGSPAN